MATFAFTPTPAIDPAQANALATNADGQVYAVGDTSFASPLTVVDVAGVSKNVVHVGNLGLTEQFTVADQGVVIWKSGGYTVYLWSPQSMLAAMTTAQQQVQQLTDQVNAALSLISTGGGSGGGVTRHSQLAGLDADDHTQYLNATRGDARYYGQAIIDNKIAAAVAAASVNDRNRANHTGSQAIASVVGLTAALANRPQVVVVATGDEIRPDGSASVWWIDARSGTPARPTNMQTGTDIWLSQTTSSGGTAPIDTTAPSAPTGLVASGVTSTGFTVSWTAATDNIAVTGYDVQIGGTSVGTPAATTFTVTGRAASTAYSVRVRARDAAGNWSPLSTALTVTTSATAGSPTHTVFGATAVPGAATANIYTQSGGIFAQGFRMLSDVGTWRVKGVRLYVPNVTGTVPTSATFYVYLGPSPTLSTIASTANATVNMTGIGKGKWNEATLSAPVPFGYFDRVWIVQKFADGTYSVMDYTPAAGQVQATDGSQIGLEASGARAQTYDPVNGQSGVNVLFGIDLTVDEG